MNREPLVMPRSDDTPREALRRIIEWDPAYLADMIKRLVKERNR